MPYILQIKGVKYEFKTEKTGTGHRIIKLLNFFVIATKYAAFYFNQRLNGGNESGGRL